MKKLNVFNRVLWLMIPLLSLFTTNVWGAWTKVTSTASLSNGDQVIIATAYEGAPYMGVTGGTLDNEYTSSSTKVDASTSTTEANWMVFTVTMTTWLDWGDEIDACYLVNSSSQYIGEPASNTFYLTTSSSLYGKCYIQSDALNDYAAVLSCNGRYLSVNSSNKRFYGELGTYTPFHLWKQACTPPGTALGVSATSTTLAKDEQTQLSTSGGNGAAISLTCTSANSSYATIDGSNKFSASRAGTYTVQASQALNGTTCGGTATVNITVRYSVTWNVNGVNYTAGTPTDYISEHNGKVSQLPTPPNPASYCGSKFMGWTTTNIGATGLDKTTQAAAITALNLFTDVAGSPNITNNVTFYAVFADYAE